MAEEWQIEIEVDDVLRSQGADPAIVRQRSPRLVDLAEQALREGLPLIHPQVFQRRLQVENFLHERVKLSNGKTLQGRLIGQHLGPAEEVIAILCTIGEALEAYASELSNRDLLHALAVDGVGSAATEALANAACAEIEQRARHSGKEATIPLSPGMEGWPVEDGQPQIFSLWNPQEIDISLTPAGMMLPRKSLSMVMGLGENVIQAGTTCDYCSMRDTCRYQDHYK